MEFPLEERCGNESVFRYAEEVDESGISYACFPF